MRDSDQTFFDRVFEVMMAAGHSDKLPAIRFNDFYNIFTVQGGLLLFYIGYYIPLAV